MKKILSLIALLMLCIVGANAEKVIYSWPGGEQANLITLAEGVTVQITGNDSKKIQGANAVTVNGTQYTTMKVSNGAQNTLTLPKKATGITFYSYINKASDAEGLRDSYWKEVAGVTYDAEASGGLMSCYSNGDKTNPDVRSYTFDATDVITFTNTGEQLCYVIEVEYADITTDETYTIGANVNGMDLTLTESATLPYTATFADCYRGAMGGEPNAAIQIQNAEVTSGTNVTLGTLNGWDTTFTISEEGTSVISLTLNIGAMTITVNVTKSTSTPSEIDAAKAALTKAIAQAKTLNAYANDADLATAITNAETAVAGDDAAAIAVAAQALEDAVIKATKDVLTKAVQLANTFGIDTSAAQAVLDKEDATVEDLENALLALQTEAVPAAQAALAQAKAFFDTFNGQAAIELATYFANVEDALNGTDIDAMASAVQELVVNALPYATKAMEKVLEYLAVIDDADLNADAANARAALESNNMMAMVAAAKKMVEDFPSAASTYVAMLNDRVAQAKAAGMNGADDLEAAVTTAMGILADNDKTIVEKGLAIRNLVLAVKAFEDANYELIDLTADMFYNWDGYGADATKTTAANVDFTVGNELGSGAMVAGTSNVAYLIYADLTGCIRMIFEGTPGMQLRVLLNRQESNNGPLVEKNPVIGDDGTATLNLTEFEYVHLNAIKTGWGSPTGTITAIKVMRAIDPLAVPKQMLENEIAAAKMQNPVAKTEESFAALTQAIADAEAALKAADATEASLVGAQQALAEAVAGLTLAEGYSELTADMFKHWDSITEPTVGEQTGCEYHVGESTGQPYGDGSVGEYNYADLTQYGQLILTVIEGAPRVMMNRLEHEGQFNANKEDSKLIEMPKDGSWTDAYYTKSNDGATYTTYTYDLTQITMDWGFAHLNAIKGANWQAVTVTGMYLKENSALMNEALELAADKDAVAVGKLIVAINEAVGTGDESNLQAAVDQFKIDNADQEKDETAKVGTAQKDWSGATGTYNRSVPIATGADVILVEAFGNTAVGNKLWQEVEVDNGLYKLELYATSHNAWAGTYMTPTEESPAPALENDANDVAYVFATSGDNTVQNWITARRNSGMLDTEPEVSTFDNIEVTDGKLTFGLALAQPGMTEWHTIQIKSLTWFATAKEVFANRFQEFDALLFGAALELDNESKTNGKNEFQAVFDAAMAVKENINMYNIPELEEEIAKLKEAALAFKQANYFIDFATGEYYIIDAESGLKMAAGHDWGTRAIVNEIGLDLILTPDEETRTVTIDSRVFNRNDHFLGSNLYMDSTPFGWYLDYQGFGFYITDGSQYINLDAYNNLEMSDTPREWIIVSKDGVLAELYEQMADATAENPVDVTMLISGANFNRNDARNSAWTISQGQTGEGHSTNISGGNNVNNCAEAFHTDFTISQNIEGLPAGLYKMTAQGFYRQDGEVTEDAPIFYISVQEANVPEKTGNENGMGDASASFSEGLYTIEPIEFVYDGESEFQIGVASNGSNQWVIFDNFQLTYYGEAAIEPIDVLLGDANLSGDVTVSDAVFTVNIVLENVEEQPTREQKLAADVTGDGDITIDDVQGIVNIVLGIENIVVEPAGARSTDGSDYLALNGNDVVLVNSHAFTGFQMDVTLTEGALMNDVVLAARAQGLTVAYNKIGTDTYRIVGYSLNRTTISQSNGTLFSLNTNGEIADIHNVRFTDAQANGYMLGFGETTGISTIGIDTTNADIYLMNGAKSNSLRKGVNIIRNANGQTMKVVVK